MTDQPNDQPNGSASSSATIAEQRHAERQDRGAWWAWICKEIINGRLPPGTTPDTLPTDSTPQEQP